MDLSMVQEIRALTGLILEFGLVPLAVFVVIFVRRAWPVYIEAHKARTEAELRLESRLKALFDQLEANLASTMNVKEHFDNRIDVIIEAQKQFFTLLTQVFELIQRCAFER